MGKRLKLELELEKPEVKILKKEDGAYIRFTPLPPYPLRVEDRGEHLMLHIDEKENKVVGFTILHLSAFLEEIKMKRHYQKRAKEMVSKTVANISSQLPYLPYYILSDLSLSVTLNK